MNRSLLIVLLLGCLAGIVPGAETNTTGRMDLQSFRIISQRNIFDPNRSTRAERPPRQERDSERRNRAESISLVGTMSYDKGWFAFFDGSSSEYRKALQPNDAIAGYQIAEIAPNYVRLKTTNSEPMELRVGMQMKKQDDGDWVVNRMSGPSSAPISGVSSNAVSSDVENDVIKRLMQKREQELQK